MNAPSTVRLHLSGKAFDLWEDPDRPFGCGRTDLESYLERGAWVLLFNAVTLTVERRDVGPGS